MSGAATHEDERSRGAREGLVEYLIVLALLVLAAGGAIAIFGQDVGQLLGVPARAQPAAPEAATPAPAPGT